MDTVTTIVGSRVSRVGKWNVLGALPGIALSRAARRRAPYPTRTGSVPLAKLWENRAALPNQVYLAAAFDLGGGCDGNSGPPPTGSPVVVHGSTAPGKPAAAVETGGEDTAVTVTFDDTVLMP